MKHVSFFLLPFFAVACSHSHCRQERVPPPNEKIVAPEEAYKPKSSDVDQPKVWVFKYDGSIQCSGTKGVSIEEMAKQLGSVRVFASDQRTDGLLRAQVCGAGTGMANRYQIPKADLPKAQKTGFKLWIDQ